MNAPLILSGASRGIGAALAPCLATPGRRLWLVARDGVALQAVAERCRARGAQVDVIAADLSELGTAAAVGARLADEVEAGATLVHNAGLWPASRVLTTDGLEQAFALNAIAPLRLQQPLLARRRLARIVAVGAGLMVKGRVSAARTPTGADFSGLRTYCDTKLAGALLLRETARRHPDVDVGVVHPGVVETGLGERRGPLGLLLRLVKRRWEDPATCAARLASVVDQATPLGSPGAAGWFFEARKDPWPDVVDDVAHVEAARALWQRFAGPAAEG